MSQAEGLPSQCQPPHQSGVQAKARQPDAQAREPQAREPLEQLAEAFLAQYRAGRRPSLSEYAQQYPELAEQIRELFPALVVMEVNRPPTADSAPLLSQVLDSAKIPEQLGEYRLLREVGRGGMGVVYEAVQESLGRHVALKVLPFNPLVSPTHLERFRREARAAARLHHTHIVPVYGVGEHEGYHFYAMQFIQGQGLDAVLREVKRLRGLGDVPPAASARLSSIAESLLGGPKQRGQGSGARLQGSEVRSQESGVRGQEPAIRSQQAKANSSLTSDPCPLTPDPCPLTSPLAAHTDSELTSQPENQYFRSVARLGVQAAEALDYAHAQGVLHRDIKPSNLLIDTAGQVWITDFGLAKAEDCEELTNPGDLVGTLRYLAPERLQGKADARSDVYGLGITLYEMLTLRPAFADSDRALLVERIRREDPPRPRKLDARIPADLETIVQKAIAKEPEQRYGSAVALAEDLRRFLADRPIQARRSSFLERTWRLCRRNPLVAGLTGFVALLLVVIAAGALLVAIWAVEAKEELSKESAATLEEQKRAERAEKEVQEKRVASFLANVGKARSIRLSRQAGQRFESLKALGKAVELARSLNLGDDHLLEVRNEAIACSILPDVRVTRRWETKSARIAVDARLERYASIDGGGETRVRRFADNQELVRLPCPVPSHWHAEARFDPSGRYLAVRFEASGQPAQAFIWDLSQGSTAPQVRITARALVFYPEEPRAVVVGADGSLDVCDLRSWKVRPLRTPGVAAPGNDVDVPVDVLGRQIALANRHDHKVRIVDLEKETVTVVGTLPESLDPVRLAWSRDGKKIAVANAKDFHIHVYRVHDWQLLKVLPGHQDLVLGLAFAPFGELLASYSWDGFTILWDAARGTKLLSAPGYFLGFGPGGKQLAFRDHSHVGIWELAPGREFAILDQPAHRVEFSPDGRLLAVAGHGVGIWDVRDQAELVHLPLGRCGSVAFHPDGHSLVTCADKGVHRWPIRTDPEDRGYRIGPPQALACVRPRSVTYAGTGLLGLASDNGLVVDPQKPGHRPSLVCPNIHFVSLSPDGRWAAATAWNWSAVRVWDLRETESAQPRDLPTGLNNGSTPAFSPDGRWLVVTSADAHRFWRVGSWQLSRELPRDPVEPFGASVAFSADSRLLALCRTRQLVQLVDPESGRELATLHAPEPVNIIGLAFSRDGRWLAAACPNRCVHLWQLGPICESLATLGLDWQPGPAPHSAHDSPPATAPIRLEADLGNLLLIPKLLARAEEHERLRDHDQMLAALQEAVDLDPALAEGQAHRCNSLAWQLVTAPKQDRDPVKALPLAENAVRWAPDQWFYVNTLGVVYYRLGRYQQALATLERSLAESQGKIAAFDLFFLAMSHARLGNPAKAKDCYDQAVQWLSRQNNLPANHVQELRDFQAEAQHILGLVSKP